MSSSQLTPPKVFISYSHKDERWKERLIKHLQVLQKEALLDPWDDRRIEFGDDWKARITEAINSATAVVLLVTVDFLSSKFITTEEIPLLLKRRANDGMRIFPVIVGDCPWRSVSWLSPTQSRPKDGKALASPYGNARDQALSLIAQEIADLLNSPSAVVTSSSASSPDTSQSFKHVIEEGPGKLSVDSPLFPPHPLVLKWGQLGGPSNWMWLRRRSNWAWLVGGSALILAILFGVMRSYNSAPVPLPLPSPSIATSSFTDNLGDGVKLEMVNLSGGEFTMGSNEYDEMPPHQVKVSPFAIGKYEITQAQWEAMMGRNPSKFRGDNNRPVEQVSWNQAQEFIKRLRDRTRNQTYRLPTEAEWEYAARAGSKGRYSFGDDPNRLSDYAWFERNSGGKTHPVGQRLPNTWGLFDMHGNVVEWCQDWYDENYYKQSPRENPQGPLSGVGRVLRGGSWKLPAIDCRSTGRGNDPPDDHYDDIGFRVVCVAKTS